MHRTGTLRFARATCTVLAVLAAAAVAYRVWRASAFGVAEALTALGTAALVIGACAAGWRLHLRKCRADFDAERAQWEAARQRRQDLLLDGDEDRALWESTAALGTDQDTCAFGTDVIVLAQHRQAWGRQAG